MYAVRPLFTAPGDQSIWEGRCVRVFPRYCVAGNSISANKSVLVIHHGGKSGQQRGTSRKEDVLDTVIALRKPPDYQADQGARFEIHFEKSRGFFGPEAEPFEVRLVGDRGRNRRSNRATILRR